MAVLVRPPSFPHLTYLGPYNLSRLQIILFLFSIFNNIFLWVRKNNNNKTKESKTKQTTPKKNKSIQKRLQDPNFYVLLIQKHHVVFTLPSIPTNALIKAPQQSDPNLHPQAQSSRAVCVCALLLPSMSLQWEELNFFSFFSLKSGYYPVQISCICNTFSS